MPLISHLKSPLRTCIQWYQHGTVDNLKDILFIKIYINEFMFCLFNLMIYHHSLLILWTVNSTHISVIFKWQKFYVSDNSVHKICKWNVLSSNIQYHIINLHYFTIIILIYFKIKSCSVLNKITFSRLSQRKSFGW